MKKKAPSLNELFESSSKSKQDVLVEENLIAGPLKYNPEMGKKSKKERAELKRYKKYHKQHGNLMNTPGAKHAFFKGVMGRRSYENRLNCNIIVLKDK